MSRVKLNIKGLSPIELVARARQIATGLTGNANFPDALATVTKITTAADEAETAYADVQTARQTALTKTSISHDKEDALAAVLRQTAGYIESVVGEDEAKVLSAGISLRNTTPTHSTSHTTAPTGLSATAGDHEGEIDLTWDTVKGVRSYILQRSADPPTAASWAQEAIVTRSSATVDGLSSGTRYWFRVAVVTSAGQSGWSDPAVKMAP